MKESKMYQKIYLVVAAVFLVCLWTASPQCADQKPAEKGPSLYERLGGVDFIAVFMDNLIDRTYTDAVLNANPRIAEAHKRFPKPVYKFNATAMACHAFGGPQNYTGRSLKQAHQHLRITDKEWDRMMEILRETMNDFKVPQKEQVEILKSIEGTKAEVIYHPATAGK